MARRYENYGFSRASKNCRRLAVLVPTVLHGIYDSCAMIGSGASTVAFLVFVVLMYIVVLRRIDRESRMDHPL